MSFYVKVSLTAFMVRNTPERGSLKLHLTGTQLDLMVCLTTCRLIINDLRAQNSQASKKSLLLVSFLWDNVQISHVTMVFVCN